MAFVVSVTAILADELHSVFFLKMLRVILHELLHTVPQRGYSLVVLIETNDKAVLLVILLHEAERIHLDITEELNAGLNPPVKLVILHQRMSEEEPRLVAAHVAVALGAAIYDLPAAHLFTGLSCLVLIDPLGI